MDSNVELLCGYGSRKTFSKSVNGNRVEKKVRRRFSRLFYFQSSEIMGFLKDVLEDLKKYLREYEVRRQKWAHFNEPIYVKIRMVV